jgi:hypothetical protein
LVVHGGRKGRSVVKEVKKKDKGEKGDRQAFITLCVYHQEVVAVREESGESK